MSTQAEILNAIREAVNASEREPIHQAKIKSLTDELDLTKYELECRMEEIAKLEQKITDLHVDRDDLRNQLDEANVMIDQLKADANEGAQTNRSQGHRINELTVDLDAQRIISEVRGEQIAALKQELHDSRGLTERFREKLVRIFGEAHDAVPEVTQPATFPEALSQSIGNHLSELVANPTSVVDEVAPKAPEPKAFHEWGF